jgi:Ycf1
VLRLQLEFILNFFVQLCNPYLEPNSMVPRLVSIFLFSYNNENKILFVISSFVGWLIGHIFFIIFFMKLFEFIIDWVRKNFYESEIK